MIRQCLNFYDSIRFDKINKYLNNLEPLKEYRDEQNQHYRTEH